MERRFLEFRSVLILMICIAGGASDAIGNGDAYVETSIINLIATPELFSGKNVRTIGVATIGFESDAIYLTADDARLGVGVNGIALSFVGFEITKERKRSLSAKYVLVEGTFIPPDPEKPIDWRGSLTNLKLIYAIEDVEIEDPK